MLCIYFLRNYYILHKFVYLCSMLSTEKYGLGHGHLKLYK